MSVRAVASAHVLLASALSPAFASPVVRVSATPLTVTVVDALIVVVPTVVELIVAEQEPVPPAVVQLFAPTKAADAPPAFVRPNVMTVPFGALPKPEPEFTFTWAVSTWFVETGLLSVSGAIWMFASTNVLTASAEFGTPLPVETVTDCPPRFSVAVACPVTCPAEFDVNVIVHCPAASVLAPAPVHEPVGAV